MSDILSTISLKIAEIRNAEEEGSITNEMVAELFESLQSIVANLQVGLGQLSDDIDLHREQEFAPLWQKVEQLSGRLETILDSDTSEMIDNLNEVLSFLQDVRDDETLIEKLSEVTAISPENVGFVADESSVKLSYRPVNLMGDEVALEPSDLPELPVARMPVAATDRSPARPGNAGVITVAQLSALDNCVSALNNKQDKLTTTDDLALSSNDVLSLTEMAKKRLFIDMWNSACGNYGQYNAESGYFELNELTDITYKEAMRILQAYNGMLNENRTNLLDTYLRTLIPMRYAFSGVASIPKLDNTQLVNVRFFDIMGRHQSCYIPTTVVFGRCPKIKKWLDVIAWFGSNNNNTKTVTLTTGSFLGDLQYFRFKDTNCNVDARYYPNIGIDSFQYLVEHRLTGSSANPIVITVHPDIYAKLTAGDTDDDTAGKADDWTALLELAASKNIQFAQP